MDLLRRRTLFRIAKSRCFPLLPQGFLLTVYILLIVMGLSEPYRHLSQVLIWNWWWPAILILGIFLGRVWCSICPLELVNSLCSRWGLKQLLPAWMRQGWLVPAYLLLFLGAGFIPFHFPTQPTAMAVYLAGLLGFVVLIGLIFEKRTFCTYICPEGHLLGLLAHVGSLSWREREKQVCDRCPTKDCVHWKNYYNLSGRSCTDHLHPAYIKHNRDCLLCTQCLTACPYDNISLRLTRPGRDLRTNLPFKTAETVFVYLVAGWILLELFADLNLAGKFLLLLSPAVLAGLFVEVLSRLHPTPRKRLHRRLSRLLIPVLALGWLAVLFLPR